MFTSGLKWARIYLNQIYERVAVRSHCEIGFNAELHEPFKGRGFHFTPHNIHKLLDYTYDQNYFKLINHSLGLTVVSFISGSKAMFPPGEDSNMKPKSGKVASLTFEISKDRCSPM